MGKSKQEWRCENPAYRLRTTRVGTRPQRGSGHRLAAPISNEQRRDDRAPHRTRTAQKHAPRDEHPRLVVGRFHRRRREKRHAGEAREARERGHDHDVVAEPPGQRFVQPPVAERNSMPSENIVAAAELSATTDPVGNCMGASPRAVCALQRIPAGTTVISPAGSKFVRGFPARLNPQRNRHRAANTRCHGLTGLTRTPAASGSFRGNRAPRL